MNDLIYKQAAIDEVQYEIEMINHALDSLTSDYNTRERLRQRKGEAREILNSIETLPAANRWIPCKERLPESYHNPVTMDYGLYLCSCDFGDGNIVVRAFKFGNGHFLLGSGIMDRYVTAWMPLPEPYKEDKNGMVG